LYADVYTADGNLPANQFAVLIVNNQGATSGLTFSLQARSPTPPPGPASAIDVSYFINCFGYPL
jgi:hypothetical protein